MGHWLEGASATGAAAIGNGICLFITKIKNNGVEFRIRETEQNLLKAYSLFGNATIKYITMKMIMIICIIIIVNTS